MGSEYLYGGSIYSLTPNYKNPVGYMGNPIGHIASSSEIGTSVDTRTANQLKEVSEQLNSGIKIVEVGGLDPGVFDAIPRDHLKELNRLAKVTGASFTFHGPMIDPTGISAEQGWTKLSQEMAERQLWNAIERSHDLKPDGNINVTLHATTAGLPGSELMVKDQATGEFKLKQVIIIDPATGKLHKVSEEEKYFPTEEKQKIGERVPFKPQDEIDKLNNDVWSQKLSGLTYYTDRAESILGEIQNQKTDIDKTIQKYNEKNWEDFKKNPNIDQNDKDAVLGTIKTYNRAINHGAIFVKDAYRNIKELYDDVYKNATENEKKRLNNFAENMLPYVGPDKIDKISRDPQALRVFTDKIEEGVKILNEIKPKMFEEIKGFAVKKSAETFGNLAFKAYEKFGFTAPIISIENHPAYNSLLTTGDDLKAVIEKSQDNFVKLATAKGEISESEARAQAKKLIGATWDVGHINMLKKYGYTDEDIIKQTEAVAPFVKKVHLSDNFGYEHTELPMGMGNVPIQQIMAKLGEKGFEGPKIVEALSWWQHFSPGGKVNPPFVPTLQAFGAPMYNSGGANWNQMYSVPGGYFGGFGTMLPEQNFQMYGAGFSSLPQELGGQMANKDSRFSGTPMS